MPYAVAKVELEGTLRHVWFSHSPQGLLLGPFPSQSDAAHFSDHVQLSDLIIASRLPLGRLLPKSARFVGTPAIGATIWELLLGGQASLFFNWLETGPVRGTKASAEEAASYLRELASKVRLWQS